MSILLDLSPTFDIISQQVLLDGLISIGITGAPLTWFRSSLNFTTVTTAVPQGSVLGPLLCTTYNYLQYFSYML